MQTLRIVTEQQEQLCRSKQMFSSQNDQVWLIFHSSIIGEEIMGYAGMR